MHDSPEIKFYFTTLTVAIVTLLTVVSWELALIGVLFVVIFTYVVVCARNYMNQMNAMADSVRQELRGDKEE